MHFNVVMLTRATQELVVCENQIIFASFGKQNQTRVNHGQPAGNRPTFDQPGVVSGQTGNNQIAAFNEWRQNSLLIFQQFVDNFFGRRYADPDFEKVDEKVGFDEVDENVSVSNRYSHPPYCLNIP